MLWLKRAVVVCVIGAGSVFTCYGDGLRRPELEVPVLDTPPFIDGDLSDPCWQAVEPLTGFFLYRGGGDTTDAVTMRLARDNEWLYLALEIELPNMEALEIVELRPTSPIHNYDSVEIFIDPGADGEKYLHYKLGISNVRGESLRVRRGADAPLIDMTWSVPWRSATKITENGWQAEAAFPLSVIAGHGGLDKLTLNIGVNRIITTLNEFGVVAATRREISSWAPVVRGFHEPARFAVLKGFEGLEPSVPLLVSARGINTSNYKVDGDGSFFYEVSGSVRHYSDKSGMVRVMVEDIPEEGTGESVFEDMQVDGDMEFFLKVPVKAFSDRTASLTLRDPENGEILQLLRLRDLSGLSLMRSYVRYSYYTTEEHAEIVCELGLPEQELEKMRLVVKDAGSKELAVAEKLSAQTIVNVPISARTPSSDGHLWTVELQRADGEKAVAQEVRMVKREPRPGAEWKIDLLRGCVLNNGEPFFPFGAIARMPPGNMEGLETMSRDIADIGFNTVVRWVHVRELDHLENLYKMAEKYDFYVIDHPQNWLRSLRPKGDPPENLENWEEWSFANIWQPIVRRLMHHPRLVAWYLFDEPQKTIQMAKRLIRMNEAVYEADGYHPTQILYIPPIPPQPIFSESCDIFGVDPYWVPGGVGSPNSVGSVTYSSRRRAERDFMLSWVTPCAEWWSGSRLRIFNEHEQRSQTYLSLIHGAHGLLYFFYPFTHQSTYETFKRLGSEMKILGPAQVAGVVPQDIVYTPVEFDPDSAIFPDVQVGLKRNPAGGYILLAANWRPYPVEMKCRVSLLGGSGKVRDLFDEKRVWDVKDSAFSDRFAPMDTRAYAIPGPVELAGPVEIAVELTAFPRETDSFYTRPAVPDGGAPGRRNLIRNPGFEETSFPGMPDYFYHLRSSNAASGHGYRIGDPRGCPGYALDTDNPFEGKYSLRLADGASFLFSTHKQPDQETPYVLSVYARADKDGTRLGFSNQSGHRERKSFSLTTEWQRFQFPFILTTARGGYWFFVSIPGDATVWLDAMQLEEGTEATEYEP